MDIGSFNLRGVIPSPPQGWSRERIGWDNYQILDKSSTDYQTVKPRNLGNDTLLDSTLYKVEISQSRTGILTDAVSKFRS